MANVDQSGLAMRRPKGCGTRWRLGRLPDARKTRSPGNPVAASLSAWRSDLGLLIVLPHHCPVRISKRQSGRMGRRPVKKQPSTPAVLAKSENWRGADQPGEERLTSFSTKPGFILLEAFVKHCRWTSICSPRQSLNTPLLCFEGDNSPPDEMSTIYYDVRKIFYYANGPGSVRTVNGV